MQNQVNPAGLEAVDAEGHVVAPGSAITDQQGTPHTYLYATRATEGNSLGKVVVSDGFDGDTLQRRELELYAHIFRLTVRAEGGE